jgi:hypothetical protein
MDSPVRSGKVKKVIAVLILLFFVGSGIYLLTLRFSGGEAENADDAFEDLAAGFDVENFRKDYGDMETGEYWERWRFADKYITGDVVGFDKDEKSVSLYVNNPKDQVFGEKGLRGYVRCNSSETAIFESGDLVFVGNDIDLFTHIDDGDKFYTYCSDVTCTFFERQCILVK